MISDELQRLRDLYEQGALTEAEYAQAKQEVLTQAFPPPPGQRSTLPMGLEPNNYAMLIHLSQFANFAIPFAGVIAPIMLWLLAKDGNREIDEHGKAVVNWIISEFIYGMVAFVLCFVIIGIPLAIGLFIVGIVFPIVGGLAANEGRRYTYPMAIPFFRTDFQ